MPFTNIHWLSTEANSVEAEQKRFPSSGQPSVQRL